MVHSRDDQELGMAHEVKSPENQPQLSQMTMGQYWLGKTKHIFHSGYIVYRQTF